MTTSFLRRTAQAQMNRASESCGRIEAALGG